MFDIFDMLKKDKDEKKAAVKQVTRETIIGDILDISFNTENNELVAILSNGQIMFCHEKYCRFHSAIDIITNFNVDAYDFRGCICDDSVKKQIRQNGGEID